MLRGEGGVKTSSEIVKVENRGQKKDEVDLRARIWGGRTWLRK
jgi:hypothetical protein